MLKLKGVVTKQLIFGFFMLFSILTFAKTQQTVVYVKGMTCPACASKIESKLRAYPEVDSVDISLDSGKAVLTFKDGKTLESSKIEQAVKDAGYALKSQ